MSQSVLIADDTSFIRNLLKKMLSDAGYEIIGEVDNGVAAIEKYKELNPNLVIMDINMPEMDGITAVKEIRTINPAARILMCTSLAQDSMIVDAIQAGAKTFLFKPFNAEDLLDAVQRSLR